MGTQAFKTQRGTTTIAASATTKTITAGVDYTAPSAITNAFIRITSMWHTGMGKTSGGGFQPPNDVGAEISNPDNLLTSITFERNNAAASDTRIDWEIIEYVGAATGANEMIVRDQGTVTIGTSTTSVAGTTVTNIEDDGDVVVFITGIRTSDTSTSDRTFAVTAELAANASDWDPTFKTNNNTGDTRDVSYAVVEFTGSNWSVDRIEFTDTGANWSGSGNYTSWNYTHGLTLADTAKAFIHFQERINTGQSNAMVACGISSTTQFKIYQRASGGNNVKIAWLIQNSQDDGSARNLTVEHLDIQDDTTSGLEERVFTETITEVDDIAETSAFMTGSNQSTAGPKGMINYRVTDTTTLTLTESENGSQRRLLGQIVQWPQDPAVASGGSKAGAGMRAKNRKGRLKSRMSRSTR